MQYESVIGLEVHAQLLTKSKIFCGCSTRFGAPPNTHTCPICLGLPGSLPVLNREAVAMAAKAGLALNCRIKNRSLLARKNYFYPDLPKGYQISQYEEPLAVDGMVSILSLEPGKHAAQGAHQELSVRIIRVHLEEDAGQSIHVLHGETHVNLNRCGVPLMEIVTQPDLCSSQQAVDFLIYLRKMLLYLALCDGNMAEGSLRCDANISVRPIGEKALGTKTEIKNLNSFRFLNKALDYEVQRQIQVLESGERVIQETRLWEEDLEKTRSMRSKEEAHDYRYFPDPDLLPVMVSSTWLKDLETELPELPNDRANRFTSQYGLGCAEALLVTQTREFADYFEATVKTSNFPKAVLNWMIGDLAHHLKQDGLRIEECPIKPIDLGELINLVGNEVINGKMAKELFHKMYETGSSAESIIAEEDLSQISDTAELETIINEVLQSNPQEVARYRSGKHGLLGFFVGQVMKKTRGQAHPKTVNELLTRILGQ